MKTNQLTRNAQDLLRTVPEPDRIKIVNRAAELRDEVGLALINRENIAGAIDELQAGGF